MTELMADRAKLRAALAAAQEKAARATVVWGEDDCLMWLANILYAAGPVDPGAPWRGRYASEAEAQRLMGWRGPAGVLLETARRMGWRRIDPGEARPGDLGLAPAASGLAGVMCAAPGWWCHRVADGLAFYRGHAVRAAWRVA